MAEKWQDIYGYKGLYQISDLGRVRHLAGRQRYLLRTGRAAHRRTPERLVYQQVQNSGYLIVWLWKHNKARAVTVHRLVAKAFLPRSRKPVANHKNGVKTDNCARNLDWMTHSENHRHAYRIGLRKPRT
jgi:hypothetical protein